MRIKKEELEWLLNNVSYEEACEYVGVSKNTMKNIIKDNNIKFNYILK